MKLGATTYPFVAFVALQPRAGSTTTSTNSTPPSTLTILSRHQGPAVAPSDSPSAPTQTSARTLCSHLTSTLLPRVSPYLNRLRNAAAERSFAQQLIAEQDLAFAASAARDRERIEMRTLQQSAREAEERRARLLKEEEERLEREAEERRAREKEDRMLWWRYVRGNLLENEPSAEVKQRPVRIAIRLPTGTRVIREFTSSTPVAQLYAAAASLLIPPAHPPTDDPSSPPPHPSLFSTLRLLKFVSENDGEKKWGFALATAYPRVVIPWAGAISKTIEEVPGLKHGGQIVVELIRDEDARRSTSKENSVDGEGSDGYDTEEE